MKNVLLFIFILMGTLSSLAQEKFTGFYEPYINLGYEVTKNFSQEFNLENRTMWYGDQGVPFEIKQVDLAHFSKLRLNDKNSLAFGLQYRFRENFETDKENELRLTEEYSYIKKPNTVEFKHRFRTEQRITSSETVHRFRYNFGVSRSFKTSKIKAGDPYIIGDLETLLSVTKTIKPEYEQRIAAGLGFVLSDLLKIEAVTEYRLTDFTQKLGHELYFVTGFKLSL